MTLGLIADTHGLVRPEVFVALSGVDRILHAGDVGGHDVLERLRAICPVRAVYGNVDRADDPHLEAAIAMSVAGVRIHVSHGHELGSPTPAALLARYEADVIVYGHTHKALVERHGTRLLVNPGAAGPRRFDVKPSVARLTIAQGRAEAELVWL